MRRLALPGAAGMLAVALSILPAALQAETSETAVAGEAEAAAGGEAARDAARDAELEDLKRRVEELEAAKTAQEDATRTIIQDALSTLGSKINEAVTFGGTVEVLSGWGEEFNETSGSTIDLDTLQLDFEVQVTDWARGSLVIEHDDGEDAVFPTTDNNQVSVERIQVDTAFATLGDTERFPLYATVGRLIAPFGISTGDPVADVPTIEDPLTVEVFEMREDAILLGAEFPTPPMLPIVPVTEPPPVRPLVLAPSIGRLARALGYKPPPKRVLPPGLVIPRTPPPPFNLGIYVFRGDTNDGSEQGFRREHFGATAGYKTRIECEYFFCPVSIDADVDFVGSLFDSIFLDDEYGRFLSQIGFVPGMSANIQSTFGPLAVIGEWNGALHDATFTDEAGRDLSIRPNAWQLSFAYQFDWNPAVEAIGAQGTYLAVGYSQSHDLAGALRVIGREADRVGAAPKHRLLVSLGEWVLDNVRVAIEYAHVKDYGKGDGGTGHSANSIFGQLTFEW